MGLYWHVTSNSRNFIVPSVSVSYALVTATFSHLGTAYNATSAQSYSYRH